ncbi:choice-of-anchor D domain-containing protein [bacterium]|nr:choice-of-anchor D domain-containing protein [bacterium]
MLKKIFVLISLSLCVQWALGQDNVEREARWAEGRCEAIFRRGDFTFVGNGAYLQVYLDKHDNHEMKFYKELLLPAAVQDIWVVSNLQDIYVACGHAGLQIVQMDTINKTLTRIREIGTWGYASGVSQNYKHAYVAAGSQGMLIINVNNIYDPYIQGRYATSRPARDVWVVRDTLALVAADISGLFMISTKVKETPVLLDSLDFASVFSGYQLPEPKAQNVIAIGGMAYAATGWGGLRIIDIQDPSDLKEEGRWYYSQPLNVIDMRHSGSDIYIVCGHDGVWGPIDVSNPVTVENQILPFPPLDTDGISNRIWVEGDTAYVCDGPNGLVLADVQEGSQISIESILPSSDLAYDVDTDEHYAYVAAGHAGLKIFDLNYDEETLDHLELLSEYNTPGEVRSVQVQDGFAFLADGSKGLHVVYMDNPASPESYGQYWNSETDTCYDAAIYNEDGSSYALLAYGGLGMMVIEHSGFNFTKKHEINTPGSARKIIVHDNRAFLADSSGVYVYNIIDLPGPPVQINSLTDNIEAFSLDIVGDTVFVANGRYGFLIWNIQTNSVNRVATGGMITDIYVKEKTIYLTDAEFGLLVYDFSTPGVFLKTGYYETQETPLALDITPYKGYVVMADGNDGLYVFSSAVQPDISITPSSPLEFGPVPPGESRPRILRFINQGSTQLRIENIQWLNPLFSFSQTAFSVAREDTHQIVVRFSPTADIADPTQVDKAYIYTNDPDESTVEITLQGRISMPVSEGPYERDEFTVGLYHMDDGDVSTSVEDASLYEKDALVEGAPDQADSRTGLNKALDLDGESDYIYIPYHSALNFYDTPFTIEAWFNIAQKPETYAILLRRGNDTSRQVELALDNQNEKGLIGSVWDENGTVHQVTSGSMSILNVGQWYHAALTWDTDSLRLYLNGDKVSATYVSGQLRLQNSEPMAIGATSTGYLPFNGLIDEIRLSIIDRQPWEFHVNRARISLQPSTIEFGNVLFGKSRTVPVTIRNRGSQLLTVQNIYSNYSSVNIDASYPISLSPNTSTTFWITYSPQQESDHADSHIITIVNSDPTYPTFNVPIKGRAVSSFKAGRYETDHFTLGLYHFDDYLLSGASDSSGQGMDGAFQGGVSYDGDQKKFGEGYSLKFKADDERMVVRPETDDVLESKWGGFTVESWFRMDQFPFTQSVLMRRGSASANQFDLYIDNGGRLIGRIYNGSQDFFEVNSADLGPIQINQWYHVALVQRVDSLFLYINGNQIDQAGFVGTIANEQTHAIMDTLSLLVGGSWITNNAFYGNIDEVRISGIGRQTWEFNVDMARITVSSSKLNFGEVYLGSSRVLELTVNNDLGIDTLVVDTVAIDLDDYFKTDLSGFQLAPGESRRMRITYTAHDLGEHSGKITFFTNDPFWPQRNVNLYGEGIPEISQDAYSSDEFTLALFHLDEIGEDGETLADSSGNGIHGKLVGNVALSDTGRFGKGLRFYGGSLEIPGTAVTGKVGSYFTVETWFNLSVKPDNGGILVQQETDGVKQYEILFTSGESPEIMARIWNQQNDGFSLHGYALDEIDVNQWYHVSVSLDANWVRFMINGIVQDSLAFLGELLDLGDGTIHFGADYDNARQFYGYVDEIRFSNINRESWDLNVVPPQINVSSYQLYYEGVKLGFTRTLDVLIKNLGDQSLKIHHVTGADTIFSIPDSLKSFSVDRLDSMYLPISFKPVLEAINYQYQFTLHSNAENSPTVNLSLEGYGYKNPGAAEYTSDRYTLALYHFNESRGDTVLDYSDNKFQGFLWNGARIEPNKGFYTAGVRFDGYNDRIEIPGKDIFQNDLSRESITLECYFRTDTVSQVLIGKGYQDSLMQGDFVIKIGSTGHLIVNGFDGAGPRVNDNAWHHMAFVYDSHTRSGSMYIDWIEIWNKQWDIGQPKADAVRPLLLGAAERKTGGYSGYFQGYLDEFRFSNIDREVWSFNMPHDAGIKILTPTPAHPKAGDPVTIAIEVPYEVNPSSVKIFYRQAGMEEYHSISAFPESDIVFKANIPADSVTLRGLEYYIHMVSQTQRTYTYPVVDAVHNPLSMQIRFETMITQMHYAAQRNELGKYQLAAMFSVPFSLDTYDPDTVFVDVSISEYDPFQWRLFWWDPTKSPLYALDPFHDDYIEYAKRGEGNQIIDDNAVFFSLPPGRAYWLVSNIERNFQLRPGKTVSTANSFEKELAPGWNMIGNPYNFNVKWSDCAVSSSTITPPYEWGQDGYEPDIQVLEPWVGYWVYHSGDESEYLYIQPRESSLSKSKVSEYRLLENLEENAWLIQFSASDDYGRDVYNYAGMRPKAHIMYDPYDRPEPPPSFFECTSLYFDHSEWEYQPGKYMADIRKSNSEGHVWNIDVDCPSKNHKYQISWQFIQAMPDNWQAYLIDPENEVAADLQMKKIYTINTKKKSTRRSFKIIAGNEAFVQQHRDGISLEPAVFKLYPNSPNPFNPATKIYYSLPRKSDVEIIIFNALGQQVKKIAQNDCGTGHHEVIWDGTNDQGMKLASGVYIYKLKAAGKVATRKMILLK